MITSIPKNPITKNIYIQTLANQPHIIDTHPPLPATQPPPVILDYITHLIDKPSTKKKQEAHLSLNASRGLGG